MLKSTTTVAVAAYCAFGLIAIGAPAHAAKITFQGTLTLIETNTGTGTYSGAKVGDSFSGSVVYGDSANEATSVESSPEATGRAWFFLGGIFNANLTNGMTSVNGAKTILQIVNDRPLDAEDATTVSQLLGMPVSPGTPFDQWGVGGVTDGLAFHLFFSSLDTSMFSGLEFQVTPPFQMIPPERSDIDLMIFLIEEEGSGESMIYRAFGVVDTFTLVVDPTTTRSLIPILLQLLFEE